MKNKSAKARARNSRDANPRGTLRRARFNPAALSIASLSMFGAEGGAFAQTPTPEARLPEVRVEGTKDTGFAVESTRGATRTDTPLRDIPQTLNIVTKDVLRDQNAQSIAGALKSVPGVSIAQGEGNRDQAPVRTFEARCTDADQRDQSLGRRRIGAIDNHIGHIVIMRAVARGGDGGILIDFARQ